MISFSIIRLSSTILYLVLVLLLSSSSHAEADTPGPNFPTLQDQTYQPSLAVVIGILGVMFVITMILIAYTKCYGQSRGQNGAEVPGPSKRFPGLDKKVIESLPFFRFSSLKGSREGLECAVCLSRFEDVELLRLLPKCRHAFHVDCIDHWLAKSSSCPLCRHRVGSEDLKLAVDNSNSMRSLLWNDPSGPREESSRVEIFVQREESHRGSWRFSVGSSFRKVENNAEADQMALHKLNHRIVVSDFVFNNRWSDLRSSDLVSLSKEMQNDASCAVFVSVESNKKDVQNETDVKELFGNKVGVISTGSTSASNSRSIVNSGEQRSVSEISVFSRYANSDLKSRSNPISEDADKEDRIRKLWLPIAKRTMQWFANKERQQFSQNRQRQSLEI